MRAYPFETYDVFTDEKFAGNQLAVVFDAEGLTSEDMQTITREFNLSETTFILPPEDANNTARVRIFTLGYEMPFAGHPTVGTSIALARALNITDRLTLELTAGLFPVTLKMDGDAPFAAFENPNLPRARDGAPTAEALEAALSLPAGSIDRTAHQPRLIGAGADYVYARASLPDVRRAHIDSAAFDALRLANTVGVYLYAEGGEAADAAYHARMFAPDAGIPEDPATGSAAAAFPGQIALSQSLEDGAHEWVIEQGFEMGRPSRIHATVTIKNGAVEAVAIGGAAVPVQKGQIFV
ncbi:MAG: PhzF family phenazine biosynthesis protein [Pseudomonadota bacterium]